MENFVTIKNASEILNLSPDTIRRWEKKGLIKSYRSSSNYRLFSIDELDRVKNKYSSHDDEKGLNFLKSDKSTSFTDIELFSGAGGLALGLENSGFNTQLLVENWKDAADTLKKNRPNWNIVNDDIKKVDFSSYNGKIDVVAGGFPCQAFSYAGKQRGFEDARGTLFFEFARCVKEVRPKIALGENVRGLVSHDNGKTLSVITSVLEDLGYSVYYKILRAQFFDVPQKRERIIILGLRKDLNLKPVFPIEKDYTVSLREAFKDCPKSEGMTYSKRKEYIMSLVPEGGYWRDLPSDIQKEYMRNSINLSGGKTGMARRLAWDEPSLTLTCNPAQKQTERCHPSETRPLNIREYARIQTFPDSWQFVGSTASQYKQIGNAVPVNLAYHVGESLISILNRENQDNEEVFIPFQMPIPIE